MITGTDKNTAVMVIPPAVLTSLLSDGVAFKSTHGIKNMQPVSIFVDTRNGNILLCVKSESVGEYLAYKRITEQRIQTMIEPLMINGKAVYGLPIIDLTFEKIEQN